MQCMCFDYNNNGVCVQEECILYYLQMKFDMVEDFFIRQKCIFQVFEIQ